MEELRAALKLATEEELQQITQILFCRKFNPLDYLVTPEPAVVESQDREAWLNTIEQRFRFLASDGITVLQRRTHELTYRQVLIRVCRYLKIRYSNQLSTTDLEAEIFLNLVGRAWKRLPARERNTVMAKVQRSLSASTAPKPLPPQLQHNPLEILLKGSGALAVSSIIQPWLLQQIARQFALHFATYQATKQTLVKGGAAAAAHFQNQLALKAAQRGMAMSAARYGAARAVFTVMGPVLWGVFFADLGWKAIATNYGRIIPTIFALAQIRLTREEWECWELA